MFLYEDTGKCSRDGEKQQKVVTKTRDKTYYTYIYRKGSKKVVTDSIGICSKLNNQGYKKVKTLESKGWEIVRETTIDPKGPNKGLL